MVGSSASFVFIHIYPLLYTLSAMNPEHHHSAALSEKKVYDLYTFRLIECPERMEAGRIEIKEIANRRDVSGVIWSPLLWKLDGCSAIY